MTAQFPEEGDGLTAYQTGATNITLTTFAADLCHCDPADIQQVVIMAVVINPERTAGSLSIITNLEPTNLTPFLVQAMQSHFDGIDKGITIVQDNTKGQLDTDDEDDS